MRHLHSVRPALVALLVGASACGGGGGTTASPVQEITLFSVAALDGYLSSEGPGVFAHTPGSRTPRVGDEGESAEIPWWNRQFYTFDLTRLPAGASVVEATLRISQSQVVGDPYGKLGNVVVDHVHFASQHEPDLFEGNTFESHIGTLADGPGYIYWTLPVAAQVRADLTAERTLSQYRLRFWSAIVTIYDEFDDYAQFGDAEDSCCGVGRPPHLIVRFSTP